MYSREVDALYKAQYEVDCKLSQIAADKDQCSKQLALIDAKPIIRKPYALVEVESKTDQKVDIVIDYLVGEVLWIPSYDMRAEQGDDELDLVMKAKIRQNSGEDWKNIKLRLSAATQNEGSSAPQISHYSVDYGTYPPKDKLPERARSTFDASGNIMGTVLFDYDESPVIGATVYVVGTNIATMTDVNGRFSINAGKPSTTLSFRYAGLQAVEGQYRAGVNNTILMVEDCQQVEAMVVTAYGAVDDALQGMVAGLQTTSSNYRPAPVNLINTAEVQSAVSLDLEIEGLSSIPSNPEPYSVDVRSYSLPLNYAYVTVPRIDAAAYLQMRVPGMDKLTLLDGELNLFFDNTLINTMNLLKSNITDTTVFAVNRDSRVSVRREAVEGEPLHQIVGQKWLATRHWKYTVVNNTAQPITIELIERVPTSTNKEISVTTSSSIEPTTARVGILTWVLNIEPNQSKQFDLKYVVSCPKNRTLYVD